MRENSFIPVIQNKILLSGIEPMRGNPAFPELTSPGNVPGGAPYKIRALPPELARPIDAGTGFAWIKYI